MNGTELKTLRQSLFLSLAEAATLHQVQERVYRHWEADEWTIPDDVAARMLKLDKDASLIGTITAGACEMREPKTVTILFRYSSEDDLREMEGPIFGDARNATPAAVHAAGIDRARQALQRDRRAVRIVTMDRAAYQEWLDARGARDSGANRETWAATMIDPPPRAKKIKQASSEQKSRQASGEDAQQTGILAIKLDDNELATLYASSNLQYAAIHLWQSRGHHPRPNAKFSVNRQESWDGWYLIEQAPGEGASHGQ